MKRTFIILIQRLVQITTNAVSIADWYRYGIEMTHKRTGINLIQGRNQNFCYRGKLYFAPSVTFPLPQ